MNADQIDAFTVLAWMHLDDRDVPVEWSVGGILIGAALVGALVTLFSTSPTDLPWLGGAAAVLERERKLQELEEFEEQMLRGERERDEQSVQRAAHIRHLTRRLHSDRRALLLRGIPIFLIIGPVVATALATTMWQALVLGATGPAALRAIGLRRQTKAMAEYSVPAIRGLLENESPARESVAELQEQLDAAYEALRLLRE